MVVGRHESSSKANVDAQRREPSIELRRQHSITRCSRYLRARIGDRRLSRILCAGLAERHGRSALQGLQVVIYKPGRKTDASLSTNQNLKVLHRKLMRIGTRRRAKAWFRGTLSLAAIAINRPESKVLIQPKRQATSRFIHCMHFLFTTDIESASK
jgi:hypothetical protein